ncbi:hypothetical protein [Pendulispora albinea]|uniref:Uncharacterized protein n=1 Tax=Pendulispora albinea TaxID=2741071 RepID=A0ABZ2LR19_9BACT
MHRTRTKEDALAVDAHVVRRFHLPGNGRQLGLERLEAGEHRFRFPPLPHRMPGEGNCTRHHDETAEELAPKTR